MQWNSTPKPRKRTGFNLRFLWLFVNDEYQQQDHSTNIKTMITIQQEINFYDDVKWSASAQRCTHDNTVDSHSNLPWLVSRRDTLRKNQAAKNASLTRRQIFVKGSGNPSQISRFSSGAAQRCRGYQQNDNPTSKQLRKKSKGSANTHWCGMYRCPFAMASSTLPRVERLRQVPEWSFVQLPRSNRCSRVWPPMTENKTVQTEQLNPSSGNNRH